MPERETDAQRPPTPRSALTRRRSRMLERAVREQGVAWLSEGADELMQPEPAPQRRQHGSRWRALLLPWR